MNNPKYLNRRRKFQHLNIYGAWYLAAAVTLIAGLASLRSHSINLTTEILRNAADKALDECIKKIVDPAGQAALNDRVLLPYCNIETFSYKDSTAAVGFNIGLKDAGAASYFFPTGQREAILYGYYKEAPYGDMPAVTLTAIARPFSPPKEWSNLSYKERNERLISYDVGEGNRFSGFFQQIGELLDHIWDSGVYDFGAYYVNDYERTRFVSISLPQRPTSTKSNKSLQHNIE